MQRVTAGQTKVLMGMNILVLCSGSLEGCRRVTIGSACICLYLKDFDDCSVINQLKQRTEGTGAGGGIIWL